MIYQELNFYEFRDAFLKMGRGEQFSYEALNALYDYFNDIGENYKLDVIGICCDFYEYENVEEFAKAYGRDCKSWDDVRDEAIVLDLENGAAVIQVF
jgi:hypothetical protein